MERGREREKDELELQFISLLIHDLETPLVVASQFLKRVKQGRYDPNNPQHQELMQATEHSLRMAEEILMGVMDVARLGREQLKTDLRAVSLSAIVRSAVSIARAYASESDLQIKFEPDTKQLDTIILDEHLTSRILDNLLTNAIRHTPAGKLIKVNQYLEDNNFCVAVVNPTDDMQATDIEDIFQPFRQVRLRKERRFRGIGLGLTFAKLAAQAQGGDVQASFNEHGEIVFIVKLPVERKNDGI